MPGRLLALAERLRDAHQRLTTAVLTGSDGVAAVLDEESVVLKELLAEIRRRDDSFDGVQSLVADRVNNLLMCIKTASNLLSRGNDEDSIAVLRQHLDTSVEGGRESLRRMREALAALR
jgi:hypothetical protein